MNNNNSDLNRVRTDDPFLLHYQPADLRIASEFLTTWLPFLCRDLCHGCRQNLSHRIRSLDEGGGGESERFNLDDDRVNSNLNNVDSVDLNDDDDNDNCDANSLGSWKDSAENNSLVSSKEGANGWCGNDVGLASTSGGGGFESSVVEAPSHRMSWADMAQEDELEEEEEEEERGCELDKRMGNLDLSSGESQFSKFGEKPQLSREEREHVRFVKVRREKDFICLEKIKGRIVNILAGLELHLGVFSAAEQKRIVDYVYELQEKGKKGQLKG